MEWMLCEAALRALVGFVVGLILKGMWRAVMEIKRCMISGCGGVASRRGLCLKCYARAKLKVTTGETTWEKLAEKGLAECASDNPFDDAYTKAMEDN